MPTKPKERAIPKPRRTFTCLYCGSPFRFPYTTGPKPLFCSRACQQKERYRREQAQAAGLEPAMLDSWPRGRLSLDAAYHEETEPLACARCGRPLGQGESLGPWRLRVSSASSRLVPKFWPICPAHYGGQVLFDEDGESKRD
mgnify:FL=1